MSTPPKQILILGGGVTGLQTAISLLAHPSTSQHRIAIIASCFPGDIDPWYTSPWAGGHWRPHSLVGEADREVRGWDRRTYEFWGGLIEGRERNSPVVDEGGEGEEEVARRRMRIVGLWWKESRNYWGQDSSETARDGSGLWWKDIAKNFQILDLEKEGLNEEPTLQTDHQEFGNGNGGVPKGAIFGTKYQSICINVPQYLSFLFITAKELDAQIIQAEVEVANGLEGVVSDTKRIFLSHNPNAQESDILAIINCTGLSAGRFLPQEEAAKLFPIRGQTILVKGSASMARTFTNLPHDDASELVYVIPRPGSGTTILGGCKQSGNWDTEIDRALSDRILERISRWGLAEELRTGKGRTFEVLSEQVGFRPGRKGGPRVEVQNGKVGGVWVIHSYGHAGAGYQNSVGCAEKIVGIVGRLVF